MRLVKRPILLLAMCGALGLAACGSSDDDDAAGDEGGTTDDGGDGNTVDPDGEDHTYVVDNLDIPSNNNAQDLAFDLDGDGQPDNALGGLLGLVGQAGIDLDREVNDQLARGSIILLANLLATDLVNATGVGLYVFLGADPEPTPCEDETDITTCGRHLQGDGSFTIADDSPQDALIVGENVQGRFVGGPGQVTIEIALGGQPLAIDLIGARAEVSVDEDALSSGKIGGAITVDDIDNEIIPAVTTILEGILAESCTGGGDPPDCGCEGGIETLRALVDRDPVDCMVTVDEVRNSTVGGLLTTADVDLLDENGDPGTDGVEDSVSLGLGFGAVSGTFTPL